MTQLLNLLESTRGTLLHRLPVTGMEANLPEVEIVFNKTTSDFVSPNDLKRKLAAAKSGDEMKAAYAAAYKAVRDLIRVEGEKKLWQRVALRSYDVTTTAR